jgi:hypothetical protein
MQDVVLVDVLADIVSGEAAIEPARADHRDFLGEGHHAFEDRRNATERAEGDRKVGALLDLCLAFAVVAEAPGLEDRRASELCDGPGKMAGSVDSEERRGLDAERRDELLFDQPVLARGQRC